MSVEIFILIFSGFSIALLMFGFASGPSGDEKKDEVEDPIADFDLNSTGSDQPLPSSLGFLLTPAIPIAKSLRKRNLRIEKKLGAEHPKLRLRNMMNKKLLMAGSPGDIQAEVFVGLILSSAFCLTLLSAVFALLVEMNVFVFASIGLTLGFFLPILWLSQVIGDRHINIQKNLPYFLDLLTLCLESGLDFTTSLSRIVPRFHDTAIGYELKILLREIQMGRARTESLNDMSHRIGLGDMTTVINAIIQSEKLGSSVGQTLRIQSEESRNRRSIRAEEMALKAPVKLLFPLVIFIFPTTFLVIFAPIVIKNFPTLANFGG